MPIPPRKPLRPHMLPSSIKPAAAKSGIAPAATAPAATSPGAPPKPAPARRPFAKRHVVARSGSGGEPILNVFMIRLGIAVLVLLLGGFGGRSMFSGSSGNQRYFDALADVSSYIEDHPNATQDQILLRIKALPISGVSDPKLQEVHQVLLYLNSHVPDLGSEEMKAQELSQILRFHQLRDELNAKYGGK